MSFAIFFLFPTFAFMNEINLWSAIAEMRKLTAKRIHFSFEHTTWDRDRQKANGSRRVDKALLRPAAKKDDLADADHFF